MKPAHASLALAAVLSAPAVLAQPSSNEASKPLRPCASTTVDNVRTFQLKNAPQMVEGNELYTALRNMLAPDEKAYFVPSQNTIVVCGTPEQLALAQKLLNDLDRPKKLYRLTYTVTEMEAAKAVNTHHYSMVVTPGQQTTLKEGSRVPIVTGSYEQAKSEQQTQVTYLDIGMNFDATATEVASGLQLRTSVDQSSVGEERSGVGPQDPVVRQTTLKGSAYLTPGKPLLLGSIDIAGTTRHINVEVTMEPVP